MSPCTKPKFCISSRSMAKLVKAIFLLSIEIDFHFSFFTNSCLYTNLSSRNIKFVLGIEEIEIDACSIKLHLLIIADFSSNKSTNA